MKNLIGKPLKEYKDYLVIAKDSYPPNFPDHNFAFVAFFTLENEWLVAYPSREGEGGIEYAKLNPSKIVEIYDIEEVREANEYKA